VTPPASSSAQAIDLDPGHSTDGERLATLTALHHTYHASLCRVAATRVRSRAAAEEVVQDTWLGAIDGLERFEGRSSVKTWLFSILDHQAAKKIEREARAVPFSSVTAPGPDGAPGAPFEDLGADRALWAGRDESPEGRMLWKEAVSVAARAIDALPPRERQVIRMRTIEDLPAADVCEALGITAGHQRVILHRARAKVRAAVGPDLLAPAGGPAVGLGAPQGRP